MTSTLEKYRVFTQNVIILRPFITYACGFQQSNSTEKKNTSKEKSVNSKIFSICRTIFTTVNDSYDF